MKTPTPKKLPSGNYYIQLRLNGKSISITAATAKECKHKAELIKAEHYNDRRTIPDKSSRTLDEAIDRFIEERSAVLSPSTIKGYRAIQHHRFKSAMPRRLSSITNWQNIINAEAKIVSAKTLANAWGLVSSVIRNEGLTSPSVALPQIVRSERAWLDAKDIPVLMQAVRGTSIEIAVLLGLHSLRMSEARALNVSDISGGYIHVSGAVVQSVDGMVEKKTNKNKTSQRDIPILIPRLLDILPESGKAVTLGEKSINKHLTAICTEAGLPLVTFHGLRHSFVSLCVERAVPEAVVQKIGGWADIQTLRKIYTHISERTNQSYADRLKAFFTDAEEKC